MRLTLVVALVSLLVGCGGAPGSPTAPAAPAPAISGGTAVAGVTASTLRPSPLPTFGPPPCDAAGLKAAMRRANEALQTTPNTVPPAPYASFLARAVLTHALAACP